jgi:hypothetical protein
MNDDGVGSRPALNVGVGVPGMHGIVAAASPNVMPGLRRGVDFPA